MSSTVINEELGISVSSHFDSGNADVRVVADSPSAFTHPRLNNR